MAIFNKDEDLILKSLTDEQLKDTYIPSIEEIISNIQGVNENGIAYASAYASFYFKDKDNPDSEFLPEEEISFNGPEFEIGGISDPAEEYMFMNIDIKFDTRYTSDLIKLWKMLENYSEALNELNEDSNVYPVFSLLIKPNRKTENNVDQPIYFLECSVPFYFSTCSEYPGRPANIISLLFDFRYCNIIRNFLTREATQDITHQEMLKSRAKAEDEKRKETSEAEAKERALEEMRERIKSNMNHAADSVINTRVGRDLYEKKED